MTASDSARRKRPTGWILLAAMLTVGLVGVAVYAAGVKSDLDDANATIARQNKQLAQGRETGAAPLGLASAAFTELRTKLGAAAADPAAAKQHLQDAVQHAADAAQIALKETDPAAKAQAQVDAAQATTQAVKACAESIVDAVGGVFKGSSLQAGAQAAVADLKALQPQCAAALTG